MREGKERTVPKTAERTMMREPRNERNDSRCGWTKARRSTTPEKMTCRGLTHSKNGKRC